MNEQQRIELETRIQDLLCCELGQAETADLLTAVANDDECREVLREVLELQRASRTSVFGPLATEPAVPAVVTEAFTALSARLPALPRVGNSVIAGLSLASVRSWKDMLFWPVTIAASLLIALLLQQFIALRQPPASSVVAQSPPRRSPPAVPPTIVQPPAMSREELRSMRQIWAQIVDQNTNRKPWFCMSEGAGEFGYVAAKPEQNPGKGAVLLRTLVVDGAGRQLTAINCVLPDQQELQLSLPVAGSLAGRPVQFSIWLSAGWAGVDLSVAPDSDGRVGVRGRIRVGGHSHEVGRFQLNGETMRVFLEAVSLNGNMT